MAEIKYPEGQFKIVNVGPSRPFTFKGNDGDDVTLVEYQVQFEGIPDWIKMNTPDGAPAPAIGESVEGHVEDTGKYGYKFVKKRSGGGGWGGKKNFAGAHYNSAVSVAADIVIGYYQLTGKKPESINEVMERVEELSPRVKTMVDKLAGTEKKEEQSDGDKASQDATAPAQPAANQTTATDGPVIADVDEKELKW